MSARNYQALTMTVTPEMRMQYMTALGPNQKDQLGPVGARRMKIAGIITLIVGVLAMVLAVAGAGSDGPSGGGITFFIFSLFIGFILIAVSYGAISDLDLKVRMTRFAAENNMTFARSQDNPMYSGMIFSLGRARKSTNMLRSMTPVPFEMGEYTYTIGSGKNQQTYFFGYVGIALQRRLPHMVLDATANNAKLFGARMSNLPVTYSKDQTLALEGDFNNYFTLYAPKDYERDALYIFSPDVMALMIDNVNSSVDQKGKPGKVLTLDAEIVDNRLFIYHTAKTKMDDPAILERFFNIIDTIGAKMSDQSKMYSDERIGDRAQDVISKEGLRLKRKSPIIIVIIIVGFLLLSNLASVIGSIAELFK